MSLFTKIKKFLQALFRPIPVAKKKPFLPQKIIIKAHIIFRPRHNKFIREHGRKPNWKETLYIATDVIHKIIKGRSKRSHWDRQKIRKILMEECGFSYRMH